MASTTASTGDDLRQAAANAGSKAGQTISNAHHIQSIPNGHPEPKAAPPTWVHQASDAANSTAAVGYKYANMAVEAARHYAKTTSDAVGKQAEQWTPPSAQGYYDQASGYYTQASGAAMAYSDAANKAAIGYTQAASDHMQRITRGPDASGAKHAPANNSAEEMYRAMSERATEVGLAARQQLQQAAAGGGMGGRAAETALQGLQVTSDMASRAMQAANEQLVGMGPDETLVARVGRITIAAMLLWPVFGFSLAYTFGAVVVLTTMSLISRFIQTGSGAPTSTPPLTAAPSQNGAASCPHLQAMGGANGPAGQSAN